MWRHSRLYQGRQYLANVMHYYWQQMYVTFVLRNMKDGGESSIYTNYFHCGEGRGWTRRKRRPAGTIHAHMHTGCSGLHGVVMSERGHERRRSISVV